MDVKQVKRDGATLAHVVVVDDHGHERTLRVTPSSVDEVDQDVLIPVSDELETLARDAVGPMADPAATMSSDELADLASDVPRPLVGARISGSFDPKATLPMTSERPHIGTGEVPLPELGAASTDEFDSLEELAAEEERVSKPHIGSGPTATVPQDPNATQKLPVQQILGDDDDDDDD